MNQFLTEVDLEFNGNFDEISAQAQAALAKIARAAQEAEDSGGSTRGVYSAITTARTAAVGAGRATGFDPSQIRQLGGIFTQFERSVRDLQRTSPRTAGLASAGQTGAVSEVATLQDAKRNIQQFIEESTRDRRRNAAGSAALAGSPAFLRADTEAQTRGAILNAAKTQSLNNPRTIGAFVNQETQSNDLAAEMDKAKSASAAYASSVLRAGEEANLLAAVIAEAKSADQDYVAAVILAGTAAKKEAAVKAEGLAADKDYVSAQARTQVAQGRQKTNVGAEVNRLTTPEDLEARGAQQTADARQKLAVNLAALSAKTPEDIKAEADLIIKKRQLAEQLAAQVDQLSGQKAGLFQTLLHASHPSRGGGNGGSSTAAGEPSFGQYIGNHAVRTLGYAIPGIAIGVGFTELEKSVKEAEQAQKSIAELQAEFEGLGQSSQFTGFASSVKNIASETGVAVSEVTDLAIAMKGVYGSTSQATIATQGIAQATVTLGVGLQEAQQDLTGITQGFSNLKSQGGGAMTSVQNELLHLQDLTGVTAKEQAPGLADAASTANSVGFTSSQTASILAAAAQHSGLSTQTIGQTFSKIITSLSSNPQLLASTEQLLQTSGGVTGNVATLPLSQQISQIMAALPSLGGAEYQSVVSNLGINASALPAANALFATGAQASQLAGSAAPDNRAQQEFNKQMDTMAGRSKQLSADFVNLGVNILNSGFGRTLTEFVNILGLGVKELSNLNSVTGGLVGVVTAAGAAYLGYKALEGVWGGAKLVTSALKGMAAATAIDTAAEERKTLALGTSTLATEAPVVAGGVGAGGAILAAAVGVAAYEGMTKALDAIFGKPHDVKPSTSLTTTSTDWINQNPGLIQSVAATGTPAQQRQLLAAQQAVRNQHLRLSFLPIDKPAEDFYSVYDKLDSTPAGEAAVSNYRSANDPSNTLNSQRQARFAAIKQIKQQQVDSYLQSLAQTNIENSDVTGLQTAYQAGDASLGKYLGVLKVQAYLLQQAFASNPSAPSYQAAQQAQLQVNQATDQLANQAQQFAQSVQQQGSPQADVATRKSLTDEVLKTPSARLTRTQQIIASYQQELQDEASLATSTAQRNAILAGGIKVSSGDLATINADRAANGLSSISSLTVPGQQLTPQQKFQAVQEGLQATQSLSTAQAFEDPAKIAQAALTSAVQQAQAYLSSGGQKTDPAYVQLQAQAKDAGNQLVDANRAITSGQIGLLKAQDTASGDVLSQAKDDQAAAAQALAAAHGQAQQLAALAQQVAADREMATAMNEIASAQAGLLTAMAQASGNPQQIIAAANNAAKTDLANAQRIFTADAAAAKAAGKAYNPANDTQYTQAMSQYYNDVASAAQTTVQATISQGETMLFLGQETATQFIATLEAALPQVKGNINETQAILQEIRSVQQSSANLNFSLPSTIVPTTLYQARAFEASPSLGSISGNPTTVHVTINVNGGNASQVNSAVSKLTAAVGGPSRTGTTPPLLNG